MSANNNSTPRFDDQRMDTMMGRLLQTGVLLASTVVLIGGVLYLKTNAHHPVSYRTFLSEPADLRDPVQLFHLLATGNAAAIIQLGILLLIATPIARVAFAVIAFALQRDRLYVAVSLIVLAVLIISLLHLGPA
jgi:uncharacterized membrane protein